MHPPRDIDRQPALTSAGLRRALDSTIAALRLEAGDALPIETIEAWAALATREVEAQAGLLERRRAAGKVRAYDGDLHLRNPALSSIDVLYDLALLLMELHERGQDRLASLAFNHHLDQTDEADGLPALPLFLSLRAAIRATQATGPDDASRYLALALDYLHPRPPRLVAIGGMSGTGKSTLAYRLAASLGRQPGARVLRSDVVRKRLAGVGVQDRLPQDAYTPEARRHVYAVLLQQARQCLEAGQAVMCDAVFDAPEMALALDALARGIGVPFCGLWLTAPPELLRRRVAARQGDASDATADIVDAQAERGLAAPPGWHEIDASGDVEAAERAAFGAIAAD